MSMSNWFMTAIMFIFTSEPVGGNCGVLVMRLCFILQ